jgi:2-dehydro-3-deoxyphosphogluconate aldolase / (4S)-4-hydroxy-2-oxoglutarate aldolase
MRLVELLRLGPVIPVITIEDARSAVPVARALVAGGVRVLEITLRGEAALEALERINQEVADAIVGVGTIVRPEQIGLARRAGARFAVSPGFTQDLAWAAREYRLPLLAGIMTPSELLIAQAAGITAFKLFPVEQAGGVALLKALAGPFPDAIFCPTGGITAENAPNYLAAPNVACVGGSWLTPARLIQMQDWVGISRLAEQASRLRPAGAEPEAAVHRKQA